MARDDYRLAEVRTLNDLAQTLRRLDDTKQSVQVLLNKADNAGIAPSDTAALAVLKAQLVAISDGLPSQVQFQLPTTSTGDSVEDLRQLSTSIDQARSSVSSELDARRTAYEAKRAQDMQQLQDSLRSLRADVEARTAQRKALTLQRDVTWNTYSALASKVEERKVAEATTGSEVELAARATTAVPSNSHPAVVLAAAAVIGLVIAAIVVLCTEYFRYFSKQVYRSSPSNHEAEPVEAL
jgi:hypothetical protein